MALATDNFTAVGAALADCFARQGLASVTRLLAVDENGAQFI